MRTVITMTAAVVLAACASLAFAQSEQDHAAHHPDAASAAASSVKRAPAKAKAKAAAPSASAGMGMMGKGGDMKQMHDDMHKPGGMHDRMHGKDAKKMGGMPAASAASN